MSTLERTAEGVAIIGKTGTRVEITGRTAERIARWHEHMQTHGPEVAATYLAGVIDGLSAAVAMRIEKVVAEAEERLAEGRRLIDDTRAVAAAKRRLAEGQGRLDAAQSREIWGTDREQ